MTITLHAARDFYLNGRQVKAGAEFTAEPAVAGELVGNGRASYVHADDASLAHDAVRKAAERACADWRSLPAARATPGWF